MTFTRPLIIMPLLALSVLAQDVRYNFASDVNFSKFKTYTWTQIKGCRATGPAGGYTVEECFFDAELAKKGLVKVAGNSADLLIGYQPSVSSEKQMTTYDSGWGYGPGWGYGGGGGFSTSTTETISIGQVDLDMYDPVAKQLVWRGTVSKTLDPKASPDKRRKNMEKAAAKLFKNYPPQKKK